MLYRDESGGITLLKVVGPEGETIGGVKAMYVDEATNEAEFAFVGVGLLRLRHAYVPMTGSRTEAKIVRVPYAKPTVKHAPSVEPAERLWIRKMCLPLPPLRHPSRRPGHRGRRAAVLRRRCGCGTRVLGRPVAERGRESRARRGGARRESREPVGGGRHRGGTHRR